MSIVLTTSIDVDASPDQVWAVLTDFASYGEWSSFKRIEGTPEQGERLKIRMPGMSFRPFVTAAVPHQELEWSAEIVSPRFFLGRHTFTLVPQHDGTTLVVNTETFTGITVRPFERLFAGDSRDDGYAAFNRALKDRVESRPR